MSQGRINKSLNDTETKNNKEKFQTSQKQITSSLNTLITQLLHYQEEKTNEKYLGDLINDMKAIVKLHLLLPLLDTLPTNETKDLKTDLDTKVNNLRHKIFDLLKLKIDSDVNKFLYEITLSLTTTFPINEIDPISQEAIPKENKIALSEGYVFDIETLCSWIKSKGSFCNPFTNLPFSDRDIETIKNIMQKMGSTLSLPNENKLPENPTDVDLTAMREILNNEIQALRESARINSDRLRAARFLLNNNLLTNEILDTILNSRFPDQLYYGFGRLQDQNQLTVENINLLCNHPQYAENFAIGILLLTNRNCYSQANINILSNHPEYALELAGGIVSLHSQGILSQYINHLEQSPSEASSLGTGISILHELNLENYLSHLVEHPSHAADIAIGFLRLHECGILQPDYINKLLENYSHAHSLGAAFKYLNLAGILNNQHVIENLEQNLSHIDTLAMTLNYLYRFNQLTVDNFNTIISNVPNLEQINRSLYNLRTSEPSQSEITEILTSSSNVSSNEQKRGFSPH